jgi:hypothetical protein
MMIGLGLFTAAAWVMGACGSEVSAPGTASASSSSAGGSGSASSSQASSSVASTSSTGGGSLCDQACSKIDEECGFGDLCTQLKVIDCSSEIADCPSKCILAASCSDLSGLLSNNASPELLCCLQECNGMTCDTCETCVGAKCGQQVQACSSDAVCKEFIACGSACKKDDAKCVSDCADQHDGTATKTLVACINLSCSDSCPKILGGTAGTGGGGGAGGGGGTGGAK